MVASPPSTDRSKEELDAEMKVKDDDERVKNLSLCCEDERGEVKDLLKKEEEARER